MSKFGQNETTASIPCGNARIGLRQFKAVAIPLLYYQEVMIVVNSQKYG